MGTRSVVFTVVAAAVCSMLAGAGASAGRVSPQDSSRTSVDWPGTYTGVVPCADCQGIETTITLRRDLTFVLRTRYLGKEEAVRERSGTFAWDDAGGTITLQGIAGGPSMYLVGEHRLTQLDLEGRRITGDLADHYVLTKAAAAGDAPEALVAPARWRLIELHGKAVPAADPSHQPFLAFEPDTGRVHGMAGCNTFSGRFEHKAGNRLRFDGVAATMMACADMTVEDGFLKALRAADGYALKDGVLSLHRARMAPLARFEAQSAAGEARTDTASRSADRCRSLSRVATANTAQSAPSV